MNVFSKGKRVLRPMMAFNNWPLHSTLDMENSSRTSVIRSWCPKGGGQIWCFITSPSNSLLPYFLMPLSKCGMWPWFIMSCRIPTWRKMMVVAKGLWPIELIAWSLHHYLLCENQFVPYGRSHFTTRADELLLTCTVEFFALHCCTFSDRN